MCVHARAYEHRDWQTGKWTASILTTFSLTQLQPTHELRSCGMVRAWERKHRDCFEPHQQIWTTERRKKTTRMERRGAEKSRRAGSRRFGEQKAVCGKRQWINRREQCKLGPTSNQNPELALHSISLLCPPAPPHPQTSKASLKPLMPATAAIASASIVSAVASTIVLRRCLPY